MTLPAKARSTAASAMCSIGGRDSGKAVVEINRKVHKLIGEIGFRSRPVAPRPKKNRVCSRNFCRSEDHFAGISVNNMRGSD